MGTWTESGPASPPKNKTLIGQGFPALQIATKCYRRERKRQHPEPTVPTIKNWNARGETTMNRTSNLSIFNRIEGYTTALVGVMCLMLTVVVFHA